MDGLLLRYVSEAAVLDAHSVGQLHTICNKNFACQVLFVMRVLLHLFLLGDNDMRDLRHEIKGAPYVLSVNV